MHIGIPYANIMTGGGGGLDAGWIQFFAKSIGLHVPTTWQDALLDLKGTHVWGEALTVKGDVIDCVMTIPRARRELVSFEPLTFVSQIWLVATHDSSITPIISTGDVEPHIVEVNSRIRDVEVPGVADPCLDPARL